MSDEPIISRSAPEVEAFSESGVDLTVMRWALSLTYKQRLQALQEHANFVGKAKRVVSSSSIRADVPNPSEAPR